jgi:hypothetical protein
MVTWPARTTLIRLIDFPPEKAPDHLEPPSC